MNNINDRGVSLQSRLKAARIKTVVVAASAVILVIASSDRVRATPPVPQGISVLNTVGDKALKGILDKSYVQMISIEGKWNTIQPNSPTDPPDWSYVDDTIATITAKGKSVLLRMPTMGGSSTLLGNTPDWVFWAMGVDPAVTDAKPGVTYSLADGGTTKCIPVFWQPTYLAAKKAFIALAGAHLSGDTALKVVVVSYANAITEDWNVPNDDTTIPSEVALWLNLPTDLTLPGAGYTTQLMIDAAIHQGDAAFKDGVVSKKTLTSISATFTQADVGCVITGPSYRKNTHIVSWISPTQVTLDRPIFTNNNKGAWFTLKARKDGLIDVAMAAFPNQVIAGAVGGNGPLLDAGYAGDDGNAGTILAHTVDFMAQTAYPNRYVVQRNNMTAIIPFKDDADASTAWILLAEAADAGIPTAGQALGVCWNNEDYRMNGGDGNNCDHDNPNCDFLNPPCTTDECILTFDMELQRSADHLITYRPYYYEIYPPDAGNMSDTVTNIDDMLLNLVH
jgi:hypothetical protein